MLDFQARKHPTVHPSSAVSSANSDSWRTNQDATCVHVMTLALWVLVFLLGTPKKCTGCLKVTKVAGCSGATFTLRHCVISSNLPGQFLIKSTHSDDLEDTRCSFWNSQIKAQVFWEKIGVIIMCISGCEKLFWFIARTEWSWNMKDNAFALPSISGEV